MVAVAALVGGAAARQAQPPAGAASKAAPPLVRLNEDEEADRGLVRIGEPVVRRVTLENVCGAEVGLRVVGTSCPCTVARLGQATLRPKESTWLELETTAAEVGSQQRYTALVEATVTDSVGLVTQRQPVSVAIAYTPDILAVVEPRFVALTAVPGEPATIDLLVRRLDGKRADVERVLPPGEWVRLKSVSRSKEDPNWAVLTLESATDALGIHHGLMDVQVLGEPKARNQVQVSLRVLPRLIADPPGIVWRENSGSWGARTRTVQLSVNRLAHASPPPASARLSAGSTAVGVSAVTQTKQGADRWTVTVSLDPAVFTGAEVSHGSRQVDVLDAQGGVLCVLPVLWFSESSLRKP